MVHLTTQRWRLALLAVVVVAVVAVGATWRLVEGNSDHGLTTLSPPPAGTFIDPPDFERAWVIILENKSYEDVVGSVHAPYFNELRNAYASMDAYQGIAHPSQPNYIGLVAGTVAGVTNNDPVTVDVPSVFDQLESAGRDWRVYAENVPDGCFTGDVASGGRDGEGTYARKHNPAISLQAIQSDPTRCARIQDFTAFDPAAADLEIIVPNLCHATHDCPIEMGDAWLKGFLPKILDSAAYRDHGVVFVLFEESSGTATNHVPAIAISEDVNAGMQSDVAHSHYSLLRTLQLNWDMPCLADSCSANTIGELFH